MVSHEHEPQESSSLSPSALQSLLALSWGSCDAETMARSEAEGGRPGGSFLMTCLGRT